MPGLSELQDILKNSFYARNVLQWVKLKLLGLLRTDAQRIRQKEMTKLVLLCFSYAIGLVINELEKCIQAESRGMYTVNLLDLNTVDSCYLEFQGTL